MHKWGSALGSLSFSKGYREWRVRVDKFESIEAMLGVATSNYSNLERMMTDSGNGSCFAYLATGRLSEEKKYGETWKTGDVITVCLDLDKRRLSFKMNDKDLGVSHENLPKGSYRLACSINQSKTVLSIIDTPRRPEKKDDGKEEEEDAAAAAADSEKGNSDAAGASSSSSSPSSSPFGENELFIDDEVVSLPWGPAPWLGQLQALLGTSLCEVISQMLTATPVDSKQRVAALIKLRQMLETSTKSREEDGQRLTDVWAATLTAAESKELKRYLFQTVGTPAVTKASIEGLVSRRDGDSKGGGGARGRPALLGASEGLQAKIANLLKAGDLSSAMQRGLLRCLLVSLEGGLLAGLEGGAKESIGKELSAMMLSVTQILAKASLGATERSFMGIKEMKSSGVVAILQDTLRNSVLPAAKLPLTGTFSSLRERVMFEATAFEVYRIWVAMVAAQEDAGRQEEANIVRFVISELTRLSPTVVADGKEKLRLQEKKRANIKKIDQAKDQVKYEEELMQLNYMGFVDIALNLRALKATSGNVQHAVDKLLSGAPIVVPASTTKRAPPAQLPAEVAAEHKNSEVKAAAETGALCSSSASSSASPSLSLWIDTSKLRIDSGSNRELLLAYRGTEKANYAYQPNNHEHRWLPRLSLLPGSSAGKFRVHALVSTGGASLHHHHSAPHHNYVVQQRVGGAREYELEGGMMHVAFLVESKKASLFVNGQVDSTRLLSQPVWNDGGGEVMPIMWQNGVVGYEAPWYTVSSNKVMWLDTCGVVDFNDHYASVLLGLFKWLPPGQLVPASRHSRRVKKPRTLQELLEGAGLVRYSEAFHNAGYDDFNFVMSLTEKERKEFYETVMMLKADQDRYENYLKDLNPPASTLANLIGMLLAGSPKVQLVIVRLLQRMLRFVPPEAFDEVMETGSSGSRLVRVLGTLISNVLWAPYEISIIPHSQLASSIPVAMEVIFLLRQLIAETTDGSGEEEDERGGVGGEGKQRRKKRDEGKIGAAEPIQKWSHAVKTYLREGLEGLNGLVQRLKPLAGTAGTRSFGGDWDDSVIYADGMRKALEALYVLCGSSVCGVGSMELQTALTEYHYYYYGLSPFCGWIKKELKGQNELLEIKQKSDAAAASSSSSSASNKDAGGWGLGNEVGQMLDYVQQLTMMYGTVGSDNKPPYNALEFNLVRLWLITGIPPRGVDKDDTGRGGDMEEGVKTPTTSTDAAAETSLNTKRARRVNKYKEAYQQFKRHEARKASASKASRATGSRRYWAAGTGYGHGSNHKDTAKIRRMKREHEERERKKNAEVLAIMSSVRTQLTAETLDPDFINALAESSVLPWLIALLKQTSALDIQKDLDKFDVALDVINAMADRPQLTFLFLPANEGKDSSNATALGAGSTAETTLRDVLSEQKNSADNDAEVRRLQDVGEDEGPVREDCGPAQGRHRLG
eukprot:jgi/Bigna1/131668/aug1.15_g6376